MENEKKNLGLNIFQFLKKAKTIEQLEKFWKMEKPKYQFSSYFSHTVQPLKFHQKWSS